jgi:predicted AAA+ superfamily ATPase
MSNLTFLTREQCFESEKLDILQKRGTKAAITDFSILLGGWADSNKDYWHIDGDDSLEGRTGFYWTKSDDGDNDARVVDGSGRRSCRNVLERGGGARPALPFSSISSIPTNGVSGKRAGDGVLEVEYGFYPQKAVSKDMQERLERAFKSGSLSRTGKNYTTDSRRYDDYDAEFSPKQHQEYQYNGKRYVRVEANSDFGGGEFQLSNGEKYRDGDNVWVEVSPVKWLVDERAKIMLTDKLIFSGVQFNHTRDYHTRDFDKTDIKTFMDRYLSRDLEQSRGTIETGEQGEEIQDVQPRKSRLQKLNPDKTKQRERVRMTDTEIIQNWIEAGESVLLRGPSGIGKTERIKSLYPDLIYMKLTNNMFPEKVVGSVNLQTGQSIPPDFAKTAIMQEATEEERKMVEENIQSIFDIADTVYERSKESDKKVVIMLDELLNVKPAVQSLVYTLVLNRMVEIGKGLKLPDNVVVVATGNQKKYSSVAEDLAEPLEKRFDHILDMEPKVGEWITEYAIPHKIHPTVIGYMLSKYNNSGKSEALQDIGYFYEEPEVGEQHLDANGCKGRTNDPRGWTSISNTLYNFERNLEAGRYEGKNVEDIIQRSIESKLRMEWASEFFDFYNLPTLTPEEIVQGLGKGYTQADLPRDISERLAYMTALITADESQVEACRDFVRKHCDPEYLSIYDIYWAGNDEKKMERIEELQEQALSLHTGIEAEQYAQDGLEAYKGIGQMYSGYLGRDTKEVRGEDDDRSQI